MGSISIKVEAEGFEFKFDWEGDRDDIERVMQFIDDTADKAGITPDAFTQSTLRHLPTTKLLKDPGARQVQMMSILYAILQMPTKSPDRPGSIYNYAADEEISAKLVVAKNSVHAEVSGKHISAAQ